MRSHDKGAIEMSASETNLEENLTDLVTSARAMFEKILVSSLNHSDTTGTCLYASIICSMMINKFTPFVATIRGGGGPDFGLKISGVPHGHYWIEVVTRDAILTVDITADQFGLPPILIRDVDSNEGGVRYLPGNQAEIDSLVAEEMENMREREANE